MTQETSKKLLSGAALRLITLLFGIVTSFFMMPFIINSLGSHDYGLWIIITSILSFYGVLDIGLSSATQRFISHALAREDEQELNKTMATAIFLFSLIALFAFIITLVIAFSAPLFIDDALSEELFKNTILIMGTALACAFPFSAYQGILTANLRFDLQSYIQLFKNLYRVTAIFIALSFSPTVTNLALVIVSADLLGYLFTLIYAKKNAGWLQLQKSDIDKAKTKELFNFGIFSFVGFVANKLKNNTDRFVIAGFLSLTHVAIYQIAAQLAEYFRQLLSSLLGVFFPTFTQLHSKGEHQKLIETFLFVSKLSAIISTLIGGAIIIFGQQFVILWVGPEFAAAHIPLVILMVGQTLASIQYPLFQVLFSIAKHKIYTGLSLLDGVLNLILSIIFVQYWEVAGVAFATALSFVVIRFFTVPLYTCKQLNLKVSKYLKASLYPTVLTCFIQIPLFIYLTDHPPTSFIEIIIYGFSVYPVFLLILLFLSTNTNERKQIMGFCSPIIRRLTKKRAV